MAEVNDRPNLPEVVQSSALPIPVAEFEGEFIRHMVGKLPSINLEMDVGYARGTHLRLEMEVRVRSVRVEEDRRGDLHREHVFALEEVRLVGAYSADELDPGVGGGLAGSSQSEDEEEDERPEGEGDGDEGGTEGGTEGPGDPAGGRGFDPGF